MRTAWAGVAVHADWRQLIVPSLIVALGTLVVLLYADTYASMAVVWRSADYQHGILVFPLSAYLLWRERKTLAAVELRPCAWGVLVLLPVVLLWAVAGAVGVQTFEHLAAVLLIPATVLTFLGWPLVRVALFPLLFLIAAVPLGEALVPHLMEVTADIATALLQTAGTPVFRQGQFLSLPGGEFEIADVCAGLRYLIAGTSIALLFAYLTYQSQLKRIVFAAAMGGIVVLANGLRAFIVMWVASASHMRYLAGRDHVYFGWVLFGVVIASALHVGMRFADGARDGRADEPSSRGPQVQSWPLVLVPGFVLLAVTVQWLTKGWGVTAVLLLPAAGLLLWASYRHFEPRARDLRPAQLAGASYRRFTGFLALAAACLVLAGGPLLLVRSVSAPAGEPTSLQLPPVDGCRGPDAWSPSWRPEFQAPDAVAAGTYSCAGDPVDVFVAVYRDNVQGRELISYANRLLPDEWRRFVTNGFQRFIRNGEPIDVHEARVSAPDHPSLVWYWYAVGDSAVTSATAVKLLQALHLLTGGQADGSVYLLATPLSGSPETSRDRLSSVGVRVAAVAHGSRRR